ncbi:BF3164 family lipoprotein [Fontibacter flavus]|uniref:BF3164 family lipoprotein n=1 Tax=Fontibacter flavus TaxID=654838 RepID=A0ABV6FS90_9BACT
MKFLAGFVVFVISSLTTVFAQEILKVTKKDFPEKIIIKSQKILTDDFNHHHRIHVFDSLILTQVNSGKHHYHVFHKDKLTYLGPIGVRGDGPDQWDIPATTAGQFEKSSNGIKLWYFDYLRGSFNLMNLTKTIQQKTPYPITERKLRINAKVFPFSKGFMGSNKRLYVNCYIYEQDRSRLKYYDLETKKIIKSPLFPKVKNISQLPIETIHSLYGGPFEKHPTRDQFVQAAFIFNRIDIFDDNLKLLLSIVDGDNWKDDFYDAREINPATSWINPILDGYNGLALGEKLIFALEAKKNVGTDKFKENESFIRVFDWQGKPLAYLEIAHDLSTIAFDEGKGMLYATDYSHELVLRFDLSNELKRWVK